MSVVSGTQKAQDSWLTVVPITTPNCTLTAGSPRARGPLSSSHHTLGSEHQQARGCPSLPCSSFLYKPAISVTCSLFSWFSWFTYSSLLSLSFLFLSHSTPHHTSLLFWPGTLSYSCNKIFLLSHTLWSCPHYIHEATAMFCMSCYGHNLWHDVLARFLSL